MYIQIRKAGWNEIGALIEEIYGMVHTLNDCFNDGYINLARQESMDIESQMIKLLDLYNKIEGSSS